MPNFDSDFLHTLGTKIENFVYLKIVESPFFFCNFLLQRYSSFFCIFFYNSKIKMELKSSKSGKVWIFRNFSDRYEQS